MVISESLFSASNVVNMCERSGFYSGNQCDVDFIPAISFHVSLVLMASSGKGVVKFNKLHH
jgi:hypothetical protein